GETSVVAVQATVGGLLADQAYCARLSAENSGGLVSSQVEEFTTAAAAPSEVRTGLVGRRTGTTAQIQGFVNPEGELPVTYCFEWSADGTEWTALPERVETPSSREGILVVGDDLEGLTPNTTYHFRLAWAQNAAGKTPGAGEQTFTTRTTVEMRLPSRGIEL